MSCHHQCACGGANANVSSALDRRDFLTQSLLTAVAGALAGGTLGCGGDLLTGNNPNNAQTGATLQGSLTIKLADFPALATVGGIARVDKGTGTPLAIARTTASTFVAASMVCPHQGTTINIVAGGFKCPNHGATFAADGHWTGGQNTSNLATFPVTYDATAGTLQVAGTSTTGSPSGTGTGSTTGRDD